MSDNKDSVVFLSIFNEVFKKHTQNASLQNILEPVRLNLQSRDEFETFSLVRFLTKNNEIAFFFQWFLDTSNLIHKPEDLTQINKEYFLKKVSKDLKGVPDLYRILHEDIQYRILPNQISFFNFVSRENIDYLTRKYPSTNRYLNTEVVNRIEDALSFSDSFVYDNPPNLTQKLDSLGYGLSYLEVGLPLLTSFSYQISLPGSTISTKGVKWLVVEEICKNLSILHALQEPKNILPYLYQSDLDEVELFKFYQSNRNSQMAESLVSEDANKKLVEIKERIRQNTIQKLDNLVFPRENIKLLHSILDWVSE